MSKFPICLLALGACTSWASAESLFGLTRDQQVVSFDSSAPQTLLSARFVSGLQRGEQLLGFDSRPADGRFYSVSSSGRIYTIDPGTGAATFVSAIGVALNGTSFGFDFNPVPDRLRLVSDTRQNLRINVDTGATIEDGMLAYAPGDPFAGQAPAVSAVAYTNSVPGATSTALFGIDAVRNNLVLINPPNGGVVNTIGALGVNATGLNGFDISGGSGLAFAALQLGSGPGSSLYTINLSTGAATALGIVGSGGTAIELVGLAAAPVPEPGTMLALGAGIAVLLRRRKRA